MSSGSLDGTAPSPSWSVDESSAGSELGVVVIDGPTAASTCPVLPLPFSCCVVAELKSRRWTGAVRARATEVEGEQRVLRSGDFGGEFIKLAVRRFSMSGASLQKPLASRITSTNLQLNLS